MVKNLLWAVVLLGMVATPAAAGQVSVYAGIEDSGTTPPTYPPVCDRPGATPGPYDVYVWVLGDDDVAALEFGWDVEDVTVSAFHFYAGWDGVADIDNRYIYATPNSGCETLPSVLGYFEVEYLGDIGTLTLKKNPLCGNMAYWNCAGAAFCMWEGVGAAFGHDRCPHFVPAIPSESEATSWGAVKALYR